MERTYKTWGEKWNVFQNDLCEVSILYLLPNQRCSWHRHQKKSNQFFVIEGEIFIKSEWGVALIEKGQVFTTNPLEWHEFQTADKSAVIQEVMYVKYDPEDIERQTLGGPINE
jgi:mannose-6-phosphate isomerase-like protein (cupin superfamily)